MTTPGRSRLTLPYDTTAGFLDSAGRPFDGLPDAIRPGAGAAIFNEQGDILLEKRSDFGLWGLPGGSVDVGESVQRCIVREVLEETGLVVEVRRLIGIYSDPAMLSFTRYPDGTGVHFVSILFECENLSGALEMSNESTALAYFDPHDLPDETMPGHAFRVRDAVAPTGQPFIR